MTKCTKIYQKSENRKNHEISKSRFLAKIRYFERWFGNKVIFRGKFSNERTLQSFFTNSHVEIRVILGQNCSILGQNGSKMVKNKPVFSKITFWKPKKPVRFLIRFWGVNFREILPFLRYACAYVMANFGFSFSFCQVNFWKVFWKSWKKWKKVIQNWRMGEPFFQFFQSKKVLKFH